MIDTLRQDLTSYPDYLDLRSRARTLTGLVAYETGDFALATTRREPAKYLGGWVVSANFFSVLGVEPMLRMVLTHATFLVVPGLILGLGVTVLLTPLLASPAFDFVSASDPFVFIVAPLAMACVCLVAAALPARRASQVDPTLALKHD